MGRGVRIVMGVMLGALALAACDRGGKAGPVSVQEAQQKAFTNGSVAKNVRAADTITAFGRFYAAKAPRATILLFHEAGSSKFEYNDIGPRLAADGYNALAIDARAGGSGLFGENETVILRGKPGTYLEAKQDLQAAVHWARDQRLPIFIWGSSYSAALVFLVAAQNPADVSGVLAFSPGEYLDEKGQVARAAAQLRVPVFVTAASTPEEQQAARAIFDAVPGADNSFYAAKAGVHGSSTLLKDRNAAGADDNWRAVEAFLAREVPRARLR